MFEQDFEKHWFGYGFFTVLITWEERTDLKQSFKLTQGTMREAGTAILFEQKQQ